MRAKFNRARFAQALEIVAMVLPAKNLVQQENEPSATHVLVSAHNPDKIELTATDFETAISAVFTGSEIEEEGSELLPASDLLDILLKTLAEDVVMYTDGSKIRLTVGPLVYTCHREDTAELFPSRHGPRIAELVGTAKAEDLAKLFHNTVLATIQELKDWKACVRLEFGQDEVIGIATDGRRIVTQKIPYNLLSNGIVDPILVPVGTAKHAQMLLERQNGHASIYKGTQQVWFSILWPKTLDCPEFHELAIAGTLNQGGYPPWNTAFPKTKPVWSCDMKIDALSEAVSWARRHVRADGDVFLAFEAGALIVQPRDRLILGATRIQVDSDGEKEVHMTFSYKLLWSILSAFKSSTVVTVNVWGDEMPLVLRTTDCQCAVMPTRRPKSSGAF